MESEYTYSLTETAENDYDRILDYIVNELLNPGAAASLSDALEKKLDDLCSAPYSGVEVNNPFLISSDIRKIFVKNLIVYYIVDKANNDISVIRIGHSLQDQNRLLSEI